MPGANRERQRQRAHDRRTPRTNPQVAADHQWPEIRIGRKVDIKDLSQTQDWNSFLNEFGAANYGAGNARALGSMCVTYFDANTMGRLLREKYPKQFESPAKARKYYRTIHQDFNEFVYGQSRTVTELLKRADEADLIEASNSDQRAFGMTDFVVDDLDTMRLARNKLWDMARFVVRGIEPSLFAKFDLTLDIDDPENEAIRTEFREIKRDFLKQELKLPIQGLNPDFTPHISFFETLRTVGSEKLRAKEPPAEILLRPPASIVNNVE